VIQKGLDRQVVLYWYQSHGRVVASEYWSKIYLVLDSIRLNRSDAALVRVIAPVDEARPNAEIDAERSAISFVQAMFPTLDAFLPS
jgi:EpsI family protein